MISNRPYMVRAMYDWIVDNSWTPHVQVDANYPSVNVPQDFVQDGVIVLNIDPAAVVGLSMDNEWFTFKARFGGIETTLGFPPEAVLAIFARENGQGMPFPAEPYPEETFDEAPTLSAVEDKAVESKSKPATAAKSKPASKASKSSVKSTSKKPILTVVK
ncbi:MAG: stringent starvation protein B [Thiomicrorhabdus sp.]|nr:MAG: stringent starvation protein B [Thiomicrorhabdus sp.]